MMHLGTPVEPLKEPLKARLWAHGPAGKGSTRETIECCSSSNSPEPKPFGNLQKEPLLKGFLCGLLKGSGEIRNPTLLITLNLAL